MVLQTLKQDIVKKLPFPSKALDSEGNSIIISGESMLHIQIYDHDVIVTGWNGLSSNTLDIISVKIHITTIDLIDKIVEVMLTIRKELDINKTH